MAGKVAPYIDNTGLVFAYDQSNTVRSYLGEPTTNNYGSNFRDFTGTGYSIDGEWTSDPTRLTKTYFANLPTPIGPGATLIEESGVNGLHHLSRYGGGSESGAHSLSCYLYPLATGITDFCIGMLGDGSNNIQFNLDTRVITYGGGIENRNAFIRDVPGWPGWIRVGANIEGRVGGWVGCFGYSSYTSYTGTAGAKKCYITGVQYEYKAYPTQFTTGTRSATQGLKDLTGRSTIDLSNVSFDSNAQMTFDGTDDYVGLAGFTQPSNPNIFSVEAVVKLFDHNAGTNIGSVIVNNYSSLNGWIFFLNGPNSKLSLRHHNGSATSYNVEYSSGINLNQWYHIAATDDGAVVRIYLNGTQVVTGTSATSTNYSGQPLIGQFGGGNAMTYGNITVVRIYNRTLSASEIQQNFNAVRGRYGI